MHYGHFSDNGKEYIIRRWDTPKPWVNYLTNGRFHSMISHIGSGHSYYLDFELNPITFRGNQQLLEAVPGKFLYLRDNETDEVWNANVAPCMKSEHFEARHGFGYTTISSTYNGIAARITYCVSEDDAEIWLVELANTTDRKRDLSVFSYSELVMGEYSFEALGPWFAHAMSSLRFENDAILGTKKFVKAPDGKSAIHWPYSLYVTTSLPPDGYETNRDKFVGMYRTLLNPRAVAENSVSNQGNDGESPLASFKWDLTFAPKESKEFSVVTGLVSFGDTHALSARLAKYKSLDNARKELARVQASWKTLLERFTVQTPDRFLDIDVNYWTKYQVVINALTWRNINNYYGCFDPGSGAGGFRNILCDAEGILAIDPADARHRIVTLAGYMMSDGRMAHSTPRPDIHVPPTSIGHKVDDAIWLLIAVEDYIRETGEHAILREEVSYLDGPTEPLWKHITKGMARLVNVKGQRGLPLLGTGDWNDALNGAGKNGIGESVWMGMFVFYGLTMALDVFGRFLPDIPEVKPLLARYKTRAEELKRIVNDQCWNGEYFIRAFDDRGETIGDKHCKEGAFYIEPQVWSVITGIADATRGLAALEAAEKHLLTPYGMQLLTPAYTEYDPGIGVISAFGPGTHENAAVFSQANIFGMVAWAMAGKGDRALNLYKCITPIGMSDERIALRELEPFVQCQYVDGHASQHFGRGACHWLTGTAAWIFKGLTEWVLGIRPTLDGLLIDPSIPAEWAFYEVKRPLRGSIYNIRVENPTHVTRGVKEIFVDGKKMTTARIPFATDKKKHEVRVIMG